MGVRAKNRFKFSLSNEDVGSLFPNIEVCCDDCCGANQAAQDTTNSPNNVLSHISSWNTQKNPLRNPSLDRRWQLTSKNNQFLHPQGVY